MKKVIMGYTTLNGANIERLNTLITIKINEGEGWEPYEQVFKVTAKDYDGTPGGEIATTWVQAMIKVEYQN